MRGVGRLREAVGRKGGRESMCEGDGRKADDWGGTTQLEARRWRTRDEGPAVSLATALYCLLYTMFERGDDFGWMHWAAYWEISMSTAVFV